MILNILIKQYSDPNKAGLQEYLSNARDSHIESGQTRPVELTLPDPLNPQLVIEDFGMGLDRAGLEEFGQFGASTKRSTNALAGGFGLGSKSGLAMAAQFTATAVKDGFRNTIVVFRDEDSSPTMRFVNEKPIPVAASTPNGVRVSIPSSERATFQRIINEENFFLGWEPYSILVDDEVPSGMKSVFDPDQYTPIFEGLDGDPVGWDRVGSDPLPQFYAPKVHAVIGSVTYKLDETQLSPTTRNIINDLKKSGTILNIENGLVEIHSSRESLIYDKRTVNYIEARAGSLRAAALKLHQTRIDSAATLEDALEEYFRVKGRLSQSEYSYKSAPIKFSMGVITDPDKQSLVRGRLGRSVSLVPSGDILSGYKVSSGEMNLNSISNQGSSGSLRGSILVVCPRAKTADGSSDAHRYLNKLRDTFTVRGVLGMGRTDTPNVYYVDAEAYASCTLSPFTSAQFSEIMTSDAFAVHIDRGTEIVRERRTAQRVADAGPSGFMPVRVPHKGNPLVRVHNLRAETAAEVRLDTLDPSVEYLLMPTGANAGDYNSKISKAFTSTRTVYATDYRFINTLLRFYLDYSPKTVVISLHSRVKVQPLIDALPLMHVNAIKTVSGFFEAKIASIAVKDVQNFKDHEELNSDNRWPALLRDHGRQEEIVNRDTQAWLESSDSEEDVPMRMLITQLRKISKALGQSEALSMDNGLTSVTATSLGVETFQTLLRETLSSRHGMYPLVDCVLPRTSYHSSDHIQTVFSTKEGVDAVINYVNMVDISNAN